MIARSCATLAAESSHLGTTMIGAAAAVLQRKRELCRRLGVPEDNKPVITLMVGYPAVHFRKGVRRHFHAVSVPDAI